MPGTPASVDEDRARNTMFNFAYLSTAEQLHLRLFSMARRLALRSCYRWTRRSMSYPGDITQSTSIS